MKTIQRFFSVEAFPPLQPARRQYPSTMFFTGMSSLLWSWLTGVATVGVFFFVLFGIVEWFIPWREPKLEPAAVRFGRAIVIGGYTAGAVWAFRKTLLQIPS